MVRTTALPWSYVPAQLLFRLPEGFLLLLGVAVLSGMASVLAGPTAWLFADHTAATISLKMPSCRRRRRGNL